MCRYSVLCSVSDPVGSGWIRIIGPDPDPLQETLNLFCLIYANNKLKITTTKKHRYEF